MKVIYILIIMLLPTTNACRPDIRIYDKYISASYFAGRTCYPTGVLKEKIIGSYAFEYIKHPPLEHSRYTSNTKVTFSASSREFQEMTSIISRHPGAITVSIERRVILIINPTRNTSSLIYDPES